MFKSLLATISRIIHGPTIKVVKGDITTVNVDAIVNAANERMLGGSGVDGAIHRAAGPELLEYCEGIPEIRPGVRCPTGSAMPTIGYNLPAKYIIHTVGPVYESPEVSAPVLESAYRESLKVASKLKLLGLGPPGRSVASVAFPAISCGVYGYPLDEAARVALRACKKAPRSIKEITFVMFDDEAYDAWMAELHKDVKLG